MQQNYKIKNLVSDVFNKVYDKYDLMNNIMSLEFIHLGKIS